MQNEFERRILMNRADGECLPLFISSSGIDLIYFPAMIIVSAIKRQRLKSLVLFREFKNSITHVDPCVKFRFCDSGKEVS